MTSRIGKPNTDTDTALHDRLAGDGNRHFVMVAGAGSGKTTSLVKALAEIERTQGPDLRRNGQQVACVTYTEVAVDEIRGDVGNDELFHVSTIHSFLWTVIKPFQNDLRDWVGNRLHEKIAEEQEKIDKPRTREATKIRSAENMERYKRQLTEIGAVKSFRYGTGSDYANGVLGHSDILKIGPDFIAGHALMQTLLTRRFPVIFVDESQDTDPAFVDALRKVARAVPLGFCLGFFGDPVQKIYMQGAGPIPSEEGWETLEKPENFRCPQAVLRVINRIRAEDDQLEQTRGRHVVVNGEDAPVEGSARVLILPADDLRQERLEKARRWLAEQDDDEGWLEEADEEALRLLVLVHRMAATRLGFPNLYSAFNDRSPEDLSSGLIDGTAWVARPFLSYVLPAVLARHKGREFEIMRLLRKHCPRLQPDALAGADTAGLLNSLQGQIGELVAMLEAGSDVRIGDILRFMRDNNLMAFDERYLELIDLYAVTAKPISEPATENAALRFMQCDATELWGYRKYIEKMSPFATQQGIKGAEFDKVIVVVDDQEGRTNTFSYGKYFGLAPISATDRGHIDAGRDCVIDRTRRLFYVCCSRALSDLAVVVFAEDTAQMREALLAKGFFEQESIYVLG
ncbi:UvrD-helicase domain-containing protein [Pelagimonas varians]|uniref:RecBCD enzyme subunit RecB n=1 Tax=Pelagimonas varians TaxID=696760 RepID=A0A238KCI9_9RHOB|nr:UvrD-helicase domain-containing protein [Pelagimonas varians]PYG29988.1 DNA helicase-2/ATP-dependent DNA helicase PcrA [Pelagimonas varians]SMX40561.1 RecBCD enzyme subunit RecB [Pelagimonas varians]